MMTKLINKKGFTLIEILIVIIVLGILAMIIVPQITVSTEDAKVSTVQSDLSAIRSAIEMYYAQHGNKYPGMTKSSDGTANTDEAEAATSMIHQLTRYTDSTGKA
ncbi:MAG: prepilin-type N-terminal cleavage/methylation domain-containing protein, partial [Desulfobacterales bacterium]